MPCPVVNISSRLASTKERPGHRPPPGRLHDWLLPGQVRQVMMKMAIEIADLSMKNGDVPWFSCWFTRGHGGVLKCGDPQELDGL